MSENKPYFKNSTFTKPPGAAQIASYIVFVLQVTLFYAVIVPNLNQSARAPLAVLFSLGLAVMIVVSLMSSIADPSDEAMVMYRNDRAKFESWRKDFEGKLLFCDYCTSYVKEKSRHCRACDRCVQNFDHHCMWINNCVGGLNYRSFFVMIVSAFIHLSLYVVSVAVLTSQKEYGQYMFAFVMAWISGAINCIFAFLLLNLIVLHIYLICKGLSTYEFIMAQRQQQRLKKQEEEAAKRRLGSESNKIVYPSELTHHNHKIDHEGNSQGSIHLGRRKEIQNVDEQDRQSEVQSRVVRVKSISSGGDGSSEKDREVIFGEKDLTHKSEKMSESQHSADRQSSGENESSVKVSQLFTRNKSLKLILGKSDYYKPYKRPRSPEKLKVHSVLN